MPLSRADRSPRKRPPSFTQPSLRIGFIGYGKEPVKKGACATEYIYVFRAKPLDVHNIFVLTRRWLKSNANCTQIRSRATSVAACKIYILLRVYGKNQLRWLTSCSQTRSSGEGLIIICSHIYAVCRSKSTEGFDHAQTECSRVRFFTSQSQHKYARTRRF